MVSNGHQTPFPEKGTTQATPTSLSAPLTNHQHFYLTAIYSVCPCPRLKQTQHSTFNTHTDIMDEEMPLAREKKCPQQQSTCAQGSTGADGDWPTLSEDSLTCCHLGKDHFRKKGKYYKGINKCKEFVVRRREDCCCCCCCSTTVKWPWKAPFQVDWWRRKRVEKELACKIAPLKLTSRQTAQKGNGSRVHLCSKLRVSKLRLGCANAVVSVGNDDSGSNMEKRQLIYDVAPAALIVVISENANQWQQ